MCVSLRWERRYVCNERNERKKKKTGEGKRFFKKSKEKKRRNKTRTLNFYLMLCVAMSSWKLYPPFLFVVQILPAGAGLGGKRRRVKTTLVRDKSLSRGQPRPTGPGREGAKKNLPTYLLYVGTTFYFVHY